MTASSGPTTTISSTPSGAVRRWVRMLLVLAKARITFAVTFSVATGYILFTQRLELQMLVPMLGVFFMACGSATINQVQEWRTDLRMPRTKGRPIPAGQLTPSWALFIACVFLGLGLNLLVAVDHHRWTVVALGAFSLFWYNGVYWALKRLTAFAVVPGALIGAIPPLIGWCAAGGALLDPRILQVGLFFFIWQIPHFWLLLHLYGAEYEAAGLRSATGVVSPRQLRAMVFAWIMPTAGAAIVCAIILQVQQPWSFLVLAGSVWIVLQSFAYLRREPTPASGRWLFNRLNLYALAMMVLLMASALAR